MKQQDENRKKLQDSMNDYLVTMNADQTIIYNNLELFYQLSCSVEQGLFEHANAYNGQIDYTKISRTTLSDNFRYLHEFYNEVGIDFDFEKNRNDGTIELMYYDLFNQNDDPEKEKKHHMGFGESYYEGSKNLIKIPNNGLITDALVAVHEISHLRDQLGEEVTQVSELLTESLAYTEELICMDFLSTQGYQADMKLWEKSIFRTFYKIAKNTRPRYKLFLLHQKLGTISKENYESYFNETKEYEPIINYMSRFIESGEFDLFYRTGYVMAAVLGSYMYTQYKQEKKFWNNIVKLRTQMDHSNLSTCLKTIGLEDLNQKDKGKFINTLNIIKKELTDPVPMQPNSTTNLKKDSVRISNAKRMEKIYEKRRKNN